MLKVLFSFCLSIFMLANVVPADAQPFSSSTRLITSSTENGQLVTRLRSIDHATGALTTLQTYQGFGFAVPPAYNRPPRHMVGGSQSATGKIAIQHYDNGNNFNLVIDSTTGNLVSQPIHLGFVSESIPAGFLSPYNDNYLLSLRRKSTMNGIPLSRFAEVEVFDRGTGQKIANIPTNISFVDILDHSLSWNGLTGDIFYRTWNGLQKYNLFSRTETSIRSTNSIYYPAIPKLDALTGNIIAIDWNGFTFEVQEYDVRSQNPRPRVHYTLPVNSTIFGNVASLKGDEFKFVEAGAYGGANLMIVDIRNSVLIHSIPLPPSIYVGLTLKFID